MRVLKNKFINDLKIETEPLTKKNSVLFLSKYFYDKLKAFIISNDKNQLLFLSIQ